ncbi:MAG: outer membrane protein assembly factor BamE [Rhodospirillales bacterium]|nr:outer membrane protein assembly factor BamE [Rhodospirillales bacterium]
MPVRLGVIRLAAGALLLGSVGACAPRVDTHGNTPDPERLAAVTPGVHTRGDVQQVLGSPSSVALFDGETWYYIGNRTETTAFFAPDVIERQVLAVHFNRAGVVDSIQSLGLEQGQEVNLVERETPTSGNELTFIQQIVGNVGRFEGAN